MEQGWLRAKAREAIQSGKLPDWPPDRSWGGPGSGVDCTVCGKALRGDESELELEFGQDSVCRSPLIHHLHLQCFDAWESELPVAQNGQRRTSTPDYGLPRAGNGLTMTDCERTGIIKRGSE